ncbi:MAG TPA: hypothetical protein VEO56_13965 [Bacteroidota bacterium]|nr:hypothetical protein [Bacteroidota bacterium]
MIDQTEVPALTDYYELRNTIDDGDLTLYMGMSHTSWLIKAVTGFPYTHVGQAMWMGPRLFILEAVHHGVAIDLFSRSVEQYNGRVDLFRITDITEDQRRIMTSSALSYIGLKYSYSGALKLALRLLLHEPRKAAQFVKMPKGLFCSQYIARNCKDAGITIERNVSTEWTLPKDFALSARTRRVARLKI